MIAAPSPTRSVVFDSDGLVFDTRQQWRRAEQRLFALYDVEHTDEISDALFGRGCDDVAHVLATALRLPEDSGLPLYHRLQDLAVEEFASGCAVKPGARELIGMCRANEVPVGLASNSPKKIVTAALLSLDRDRTWFDAVVTGDEVGRQKPFPDLYELACRRLAAVPSESIAIDDSPTGVAAAVAAGMFVVYVPSDPLRRHATDAALTVPSLESDALLETLARAGIAA